MKKKNVLILVCVIVIIAAIAIGGVIMFSGNSKNEIGRVNKNEETINNETNEEKEITYLDMYKDYLEDDIFNNSKIKGTKVVGGLFKIENISKPVLLVKYQGKDNSYYIRVLHIIGDEVIASDDYKSTSISCSYNLENKEIVYFIKDLSNKQKYKSVTDIVNEKTNITELSEDDFGKEYILFEDEVEFYTIESDKVEEGLNKIEKNYKNQDMTSINKQIDEIEANRLKIDEKGIYNEKYRISFGTYAYNPETTITIKTDNSVHYEYVIPTGLGMPVKYDGSFYLENDRIVCKVRLDNPEFKVIDNNKIQRTSDNTIWNLKNE